jgi:hypothetical protein
MIENMKDLKSALNSIPDEVLKNYVVGLGPDSFGIGCSMGEDEVEMAENDKCFKEEHHELEEVCRYFENVIKAATDDNETDIVDSSEGRLR